MRKSSPEIFLWPFHALTFSKTDKTPTEEKHPQKRNTQRGTKAAPPRFNFSDKLVTCPLTHNDKCCPNVAYSPSFPDLDDSQPDPTGPNLTLSRRRLDLTRLDSSLPFPSLADSTPLQLPDSLPTFRLPDSVGRESGRESGRSGLPPNFEEVRRESRLPFKFSILSGGSQEE